MGELRFEVDCPADVIHFQEEMELLFVLSGRCAVTSGENSFTLESEGLCVFNSFELHEIMREAGGHTLSLYIPLDYLDQGGMGTIFCCSALQPEKAVFLNIVRSRLALLFQEYQSPARNGLYLMSHLTSLLGMLRQEFEEPSVPFEKAKSESQRLTAILAYIRDNLEEEVTLQSTAEAFYLSPAHLSRRFRQLTGYGFSDFVRTLKLDRAAILLTHSSVSVTEIAVRCGFGNANTFINAFQHRYGCTPGKYRKANRVQVQDEFPNEISFMSLTQYTKLEGTGQLYSQRPEEPVRIELSAKKSGTPLEHGLAKTANLGYAKDLLLESVQRLLRKAVQEIGLQMIYFGGVLDPSLNVFHMGKDGEPRLNFTYLDMAMDFILSLGVKPWLCLSFTPPELVNNPNNFFGEACMNLPDNLDAWEKTLTLLLEHFSERYGHREVKQWHYSIEPALYEYYGVFTLEHYEAFYLRSFQAVRRSVPNAYFSAFGLDTGICTLDGQTALQDLLRFARENNCLPNEICFQSFSVDYRQANIRQAEVELVDQSEDMLGEPIPLSSDPDLVSHELDAIRRILSDNSAENLPISFFVWNNTIWQRDLGNDTCFKSAWLVKNLSENRGRLTAAAVGLTDYSERSIQNPNVFHGGVGLMSHLGFPKAGYHALSLLNRLHGDVIASGDGYLIVRNEDDFMILLYHYCHHDLQTHLSRQLPQKEQRIYDRYYGFEKKGSRSFQFLLRHLPQGVIEADSYRINRSYGSSYDIWMAMGAPERFSREQLDYLESVAVPKYQYDRFVVDEKGELLFSVLLEPHEIRLIRLQKR